MSFKFAWLCELFNELEKNRHRHSTSVSKVQNPDHAVVRSWFNRYDSKIKRSGPAALALLSAFFPERRVDRVYNLQENRLSAIIGRALGLGTGRLQELNRWRCGDGENFAICVQQIMAQCEFDPPSGDREVVLAEVEAALDQIAANSPFSSPKLKARANCVSVDALLTPILRRLQSHEAKWLICMLLKSYAGIQIPETMIMTQFHFLLPDLLAVQNSFDAAVKILGKSAFTTLTARPSKEYEKALRPLLAKEVMPEIGIMVSRQPYHKARSIKHCCQMANQRQMSVETKYDGEYCQIHIDLSRGRDCIQIFSKSAKDSTEDRSGLHNAIRHGLALGQDDCGFRKHCIVEGELLVWSTRRRCILPFHKIRKYVRHGGRRLGCADGSPLRSDESLMVVFYDILLLDDKTLMGEATTVRRHYLERIVRTFEGKCVLGERQVIDFSKRDAPKRLRKSFARSISERWEGFVLKSCEDAYHSWAGQMRGIKLKKDYINGLGDSADLCIVGGRRDANVESILGVGTLTWTSFHLGCLTNKEEVRRYNSKPKFKVIDELTHHGMPRGELVDLNMLGSFRSSLFSSGSTVLEIEMANRDVKVPTDIFNEPFVVEIIGAGFEKPSNCSFYTLRFPRKSGGKIKLHLDRSIVDTVSFKELQVMAQERIEPAGIADDHQDAQWIRKLLQAEGRSQSTSASTELPSPGQTSTTKSDSNSPGQKRVHARGEVIYIRPDSQESSDVRLAVLSRGGSRSDPIEIASPSPTTSQDRALYNQGLKRAREVLGEISSRNARKVKRPRIDIGDRQSNGRRTHDGFENDPSCTSAMYDAKVECDVVSNTEAQAHRVPALDTEPFIANCQDAAHQMAGRAMGSLDEAISKASRDENVQLSTPPSTGSLSNSSPHADHEIEIASSDTENPEYVVSEEQGQGMQSTGKAPNIVEDIAGPVYIPPSVARIPAVQRTLYKDLFRFDISHTHIMESVIDSLKFERRDNPPHQQGYHIMLLDFTEPAKAKVDLDQLFEHLLLASGQTLEQPEPNCPERRDENDLQNKVRRKLDFEDRIMVWDYSLFTYLRHHPYHRQHQQVSTKTSTGRSTTTSTDTSTRTRTMSTIGTNDMNNDILNLDATTTTTQRQQMRLTTEILAQLQHDHDEGVELFAGFLRVNSRALRQDGVYKPFLFKEWNWH